MQEGEKVLPLWLYSQARCPAPLSVSPPNSPLSHAAQRHDSSPARGGAKFTLVGGG